MLDLGRAKAAVCQTGQMPDSLEKLAILCTDFGHTRRKPLRIGGARRWRVLCGVVVSMACKTMICGVPWVFLTSVYRHRQIKASSAILIP